MGRFMILAGLATIGLLFAHGAEADPVLDWNEVALAEVTASGQLPPDGARTMAMVHVARGHLAEAETILRQGAAVQDRQIGRGGRADEPSR